MPSVLHLHKASAGSGKTYTLTRQYIEYLLVNDEGRLCRRRQITDNLRHILAITFTNKATAEMKERIVSALSKLAYSDYTKRRPDYLDYLTELTGASEEEVRGTAKTSLSVLLNAYSDFNVSTIDSFFQTILRTFAYEIERSDSYGIELDSDFVARSAVDAALTDMNSDNPDRQVRNWLQNTMERDAEAGKRWNIFAKKTSGGTTYGQLLRAVEKMSSEDYKKHREALKKYLDAHRDAAGKVDITDLYERIDNIVKTKLRKHYCLMQDYARKVAAVIGSYDEKKHLNKDLAGRVKKTLSYPVDGVSKPWTTKAAPDDKLSFKADKIKEGLSPVDRAFADDVIAMVENYREWYEELHSEELRTWELYSKNFRMLPMMSAASELSAEQLARDNIIDMSETSTILDKVIGDQDSPFIFERIGNQLNHFLIDEFQDTSAMQWKVLRPLVSNALSEGHSNLIIGDGKQSIYRFRGADPSLIMTQVPGEFSYCASIKGDKVQDNTNYRSFRNIVEFNNTLFRLVAEEMDEAFAGFVAGTGAPLPPKPFFAGLYAGVTQRPGKEEPKGYVQLLTYGKGSASGFGGNQPEPAPHLIDIAAKIAELRERGYRYSDIAVLVRTKQNGTNVIGAIIQWNNEHPDKMIPFISEESLTVGSAPSVRILLSALSLVGEGDITRARQENSDEKDSGGKHRRTLSEALFLCSYAKFVHSHPEIKPEEMMAAYSAAEPDPNPLDFITTDARNIELPALVEKLIGSLLTRTEQRSDAPYIAAFQDLVIDYCERHSADIRSFLQWWEQKGVSKGINSPENIEAVKILTIHKAKGLQYRCVIIPELKAEFRPDRHKTEWLWVKPSAAVLGLPDRTLLPEVLPVESGEKMEQTPHKDVYAEYRRLYMMDLINTWYVAFTRPVEELYIYAWQKEEDENGKKSKEEPSFQRTLLDIFTRMKEGSAQGDGLEYQLGAGKVSIIGEAAEVPENQGKEAGLYLQKATVGRPLAKWEIEAGNPGKPVAATVAGDGYFEHDPGKFIQYRDVEFDYVDSENPDPQWEGNKMHDIMSRVNAPEDLDGAVRAMVAKGRITPREGEHFLSVLRPAIETTGKEYGWFSPGLRVLNERSLLQEGDYDRRPDRVIIDSEGRATVIDYKFGMSRERGHLWQVRRYVKLMRETAAFTEVRGFLWYVNLQEVREV